MLCSKNQTFSLLFIYTFSAYFTSKLIVYFQKTPLFIIYFLSYPIAYWTVSFPNSITFSASYITKSP